MLLVIGAVTKGHFAASGATLSGGIAILALSTALPEEQRRLAFFLGLLGAIAGGVQLLVYFCMLKSYGWRPEAGEHRTVWACQYCTQQFATFDEAAQHEQACPMRTGPGNVSNIVGVPMGGAVPMPTPMGQVVSQQAYVPQGQQYAQYGMPAGTYGGMQTPVQAHPVQGTIVGGGERPAGY
ncbi:unnamed protein product [Prorocentrum cordatum]|uniref:Uncharacterized protein n=1 Tax=Prorocentrum cordatum TaxID=2364126 RepID=A0ABN9SNB3_9DINO|nr:unnamed protein product [Polarella glacialis]